MGILQTSSSLSQVLQKTVFNLMDEGDITTFLGIDSFLHFKISFEKKQPYLIYKVNDLVGFDGDASWRPTSVILPLIHNDMERMEYHQK